ncbi:MAG: S16 family serine protease [Anaerolineae bacterium]
MRVSLGGVRDEAEIRGHRRTYIGALPGRIIQTLRRAGTVNPVFMLDEIDKLGHDFRGDPASALLEILDPEQNNAYSDHYLEVPYDLSKVMFITTANTLDPIPPALLDRLEVIEFNGYIEEEKLSIAEKFLIPRQLEEHGLSNKRIVFEEQALRTIIREYTYEAGVRNFEREIANVCRKLARKVASKEKYSRKVTPEVLSEFLGPAQFLQERLEDKDQVGLATGVAYTDGGGDVMVVEVMLLPGKGNITFTGQLGDVMQESAQAAYSYVRSQAKTFDIKPSAFDKNDIHVHLPEGAIPKEGPSAGITLATAMLSAMTGRPVHGKIALTGEITLRGKVLPVGGIKEKMMAAHRAGLRKILLPDRNRKDVVEIPRTILDEMEIRYVSEMSEVLEVMLAPAVTKPKPKSPSRSKRSPNKTKPSTSTARRPGTTPSTKRPVKTPAVHVQAAIATLEGLPSLPENS